MRRAAVGEDGPARGRALRSLAVAPTAHRRTSMLSQSETTAVRSVDLSQWTRLTWRSMKQVTIHEAKTHLSRLIREAIAGEEIIIARGRTAVVKLVALEQARTPRKFGTGRGVATMAPDFDEPLEDFAGYR